MVLEANAVDAAPFSEEIDAEIARLNGAALDSQGWAPLFRATECPVSGWRILYACVDVFSMCRSRRLPPPPTPVYPLLSS